MHQLNIATQPERETEIVQIEGAVDANNFPSLSSLLINHLKACQVNGALPQIVLDCRGISYIGSYELQEIIELALRARAHGGDIKCASLSPTIEQVLNLIGHGDSLDCQPTIHSALDAFHSTPVAA
jgi:anti-anti-sigma factor